VACVAAWYSWQFLDLFPLAEYRDWINTPMSWADVVTVGRQMLTQDNPPGFCRCVSWCYARLSGLLAGTNTYGLNGLALLVVVASCLPAYGLCRQVAIKPFGSLAVVLLWAFSLPTIDIVAWQASLHDRCALLFILLSLNLAMAILRPMRKKSAQAAAVLGLTLCVFAAYNSKEMAFLLMPSMLLLILFAGADTWIGKLKQAALFAIPLLYVGYHNLRYVYYLRHADDTTHCLGGSLAANWRVALSQCLGSAGDFNVREVGVCATFVIAIALGVLVAWSLQGLRASPDVRRRFGLNLWLWMNFGMAIAITLKTQCQPPYERYIPQFFLFLAAVQGLSLLGDLPWRGERAVRWIGCAALSLLLCWNGYYFFTRVSRPYQELARLSRHFATSMAEAHRQVDLLRQDRIELVIPLSSMDLYLFSNGTPMGLLRLVTPPGDAARARHLPTINGVSGVDLKQWRPSDSGTCYICFTHEMTLDSIYCGGKRLVPAAIRN
jgi:hypothetical protein